MDLLYLHTHSRFTVVSWTRFLRLAKRNTSSFSVRTNSDCLPCSASLNMSGTPIMTGRASERTQSKQQYDNKYGMASSGQPSLRASLDSALTI